MKLLIRFTIIASVVIILYSCTKSQNTKISQAENLLETDPVESLRLLEQVNTNNMSNEDRALFALVKTQALYKCDIPAESDSLINIALEFYTSGRNYIQSIIFKGIVEYEMGNDSEAISWLKTAENKADKADYEMLGYINMQLGNIYLDSYIENKEDIEKYKKALAYYTKANNTKRCQVLNGIIGGSYRTTNIDSSRKYLNRAINLDLQAKDSFYLFMHYEMLARALYVDSNYVQSKDLAVYSIKKGDNYYPSTEAIHDAVRAYAQLGRLDSAKFYLSCLKQSDISPQENVKLLTTKTILFEKEGNYKEALMSNRAAVNIADSIVDSSHQQQLYLKEKLYDTQLLKEENERVRHKRLRTIFVFIIVILLLSIFSIIIYVRKQRQIREMQLLQEEFQSAHKLALEEIVKKESASNEIHKAMITQIGIVKRLIDKSYYCGNQSNKFNDEFKKTMQINTPDQNFWDGIVIHANIAYDDIITKLRLHYSNLTEQDIFYVCMMFCDFSLAEIIVCMGYTNSHSASNRQLRIARKMGLDISLSEFVNKVKNKEIQP